MQMKLSMPRYTFQHRRSPPQRPEKLSRERLYRFDNKDWEFN